MKKIPLYAQILSGMLAGALVGILAGPKAAPFGEIGKALIQLIKTLAAPLLFFAIVDAFLRTRMRLKSALTMVAITAVNAGLAVAIGLGLSNILRPGEYLRLPKGFAASAAAPVAAGKIEFVKTFAAYVPESLLKPFVDNAVISIILVAVLLGAALRRVGADPALRESGAMRTVENLVAVGLRVLETLLGGIIAFIPLAVFGVTAKVVGEQGFEPLKGLLSYVGVVLAGLALHVAVVYQGWLVLTRYPLGRFWGAARDPVVYALGASSSLATLPLTLRALEKLKVSPESARLAACVGTNLNNDGILLYEALAILFVAQAHGIHLGPGEQLVAALSCVIAGVGITGVPEAGLISLSLALATVGLPVEILPLLLTVDWVLGRVRAAVNVTSDMLVAVLLDRFGRGPVLAAASEPAEAV